MVFFFFVALFDTLFISIPKIDYEFTLHMFLNVVALYIL